ncbi:hypothetical protein HRG_005232 [Hirsutella rhossiliensis]|uniref:Fungal N-terminal domain-containing protein n=1 Tax=Hirsutella rhossiliensis TaxID=111463 RepID=A0A9P8MXC1_9HYPO|nr:uncharacterized protein HRG_05232 [Hirsutella rhossiliensis]KAH0962722.1 hypothetical protein HRG_05232 [Hirsutella rhossiliensis]
MFDFLNATIHPAREPLPISVLRGSAPSPAKALSIAASIAGLIALAGKVAELSHEPYDSTVLSNCESTVRNIQHRLVLLRQIIVESAWYRLMHRSRFNSIVSEVTAMTEHLAAFKLTLNIALQLRLIRGPNKSDTGVDLDRVRADILYRNWHHCTSNCEAHTGVLVDH